MELDFKRFYKRLDQFSFFFRSRIEWIEASKSQFKKLNNVIKKIIQNFENEEKESSRYDYRAYFSLPKLNSIDEFLNFEEKKLRNVEWFNITIVKTLYNGVNNIAIAINENFDLYFRSDKIYEGRCSTLDELIDDFDNYFDLVILLFKKGIYQKIIKFKNYKFMFGEIKAKDYFKYFPKIYNEIFNGYDEKRKERLLYELKINNESLFATHFKKMSANKYYKDCALAFKLFDKYNYKLSYEKNFYKNADGRVQGLNEIDADSKKEFDKWYKENERFFVHTFEIFPGSSRYRIYLYIDKDDDGYYYRLIGINNDTLLDIGKIFLEFLKHGIRVEVSNSFKFIDFLKGEFVFKVVPSYSTYSHYFEQLCVEDLRYKKFIQSIKWHEPHIAKFKNKSK